MVLKLDTKVFDLAGRVTEEQVLRSLHGALGLSDVERKDILLAARNLVADCREHTHERPFLDQFITEYGP